MLGTRFHLHIIHRHNYYMACIDIQSDPHNMLPTAITGPDLAKNGEPVALRAALWNVWLPAPGLTGNVSLIQELTCACNPAQA